MTGVIGAHGGFDITMEETDGISLSASIRKVYPAIKILIISVHARGIYIEKASQAGVEGYLIKNASDEELKLAVADPILQLITLNYIHHSPLTTYFVQYQHQKKCYF